MVQMCLCHKDTAVQQAAPYYRKADSSLCAYNLPEKTKKKKPARSDAAPTASDAVGVAVGVAASRLIYRYYVYLHRSTHQ